MIVPVLLTLFSISSYSADKIKFIYDYSGGLTDVASPDRIADKYTTDLVNVDLDEDSGFVTRKGLVKYNTTPTEGLASHDSGYVYKKSNGTHYFISQSSNSIFYSDGSGSLTALIGSLSNSVRSTYATALDVLYGGNGTNNEWSWNGTTLTSYDVSNSTNMVKGLYHCFYKNRMFRAGVTGFLSTLYWSELIDPANGGTGTNFVYVSQDDGGFITGLYPSPTGDYLIIFKNTSIWGLYGDYPNWRLKCINSSVGCLYNSSVDYLNNDIVFVSHRGIEKFDGLNLTLISEPVDKQIKALPQLNVGIASWEQTSAADWGAGTGTNIDTTTYNGSVAIENSILHISSNSNSTEAAYFGSCENLYYQSLFIPNYNCQISSISFWARSSIEISTSSYLNVFILDTSSNVVSSGNLYFIGIDTTTTGNKTKLNVNMSEILVYSTSTYILRISSSPIFNNSSNSITFAGRTSGELTKSYIIVNNNKFNEGTLWSYILYGYNKNASYVSQSKLANSWGAWGNFIVNDTIPANSTIEYYAVTSTSVYNLSTNTPFRVYNNLPINSTVNPYIKIIGSFTRTDYAANPLLNNFTISWQSADNINHPCGMVYQEAYYLAVASTVGTAYNNVVYRYNKNGIFEIFNNVFVNSWFNYRNSLYSGNSNENGYIYKWNNDSTYTDDSSYYTNYYITRIYDMDNPLADKIYKAIWVNCENSGNPINIRYRLNGSSGDWTSATVLTNDTDKTTVKKVGLPNVRGKFIQLKADCTGYMNVRGMAVVYEEVPVQ